MKFSLHLFAMIWVCGLFAGCVATRTDTIEPGRDLRDTRRFFVLRNLKDNHGLDGRIVRALQKRGFEAESGPITLLPASAQAVLMYEDRWAWDFSDHMTYLRISVRDPQAAFPYRSAFYQKHVAFTTQVDEVVDEVLTELLAVQNRK